MKPTHQQIISLRQQGLTFRQISDRIKVAPSYACTIYNRHYPRSVPFRIHDPLDIYFYLIDFKKSHDGNTPTLREIAADCGISSISLVNNLLLRLRKRGLIDLDNRHRIEIVSASWTPPHPPIRHSPRPGSSGPTS